jgi:hypothetical protein
VNSFGNLSRYEELDDLIMSVTEGPGNSTPPQGSSPRRLNSKKSNNRVIQGSYKNKKLTKKKIKIFQQFFKTNFPLSVF